MSIENLMSEEHITSGSSAARIRELERGLQDAVSYLRRLPQVPTTTAIANRLDALLQKGSMNHTERSYSVDAYTAAGLPWLRAEFVGPWLYIECPLASDAEVKHADVIGRLRDGVQLTGQQRNALSPLSDLEVAYSEVRSR